MAEHIEGLSQISITAQGRGFGIDYLCIFLVVQFFAVMIFPGLYGRIIGRFLREMDKTRRPGQKRPSL